MDARPDGAVRRPSRGDVIAHGLMWASRWSLRFTIVVIGLYLLWYVMGLLWVIVLPVLLAIIIATVAWPPVAWMRRHGAPPAVAAGLVMLLGLALLGLLSLLLARSISGGIPEIASRAGSGIASIQRWVAGPPLNLGAGGQFDAVLAEITTKLQQSITVIVTSVASGVGVVASSVVTALLAIVLAFLFVKDGPRFLPWLRGVVGHGPGAHLAELLGRIWATVSGFVYTQAVVALIDSVLIGLGLVILDVPLALPLAVLTFLGGFIPIVGALVAGALAVLVALVSNGFTTALIVLAIILVVQQLEGNVLQPILQSRSLSLHAAIVLLAVTAGGSLYGIGGAFLAVPAVAAAAVVLRYFGELIDERTGEGPPPDSTDGPELGAPGEVTPVGRPVGTAGEEAEREGSADAGVPPGTSRS
ncbi:AI-2E family transporter [Pseudonocardia sp.]|uniref:AI-2E family transporter n=1 Tax=Pseudonocardia sp. TaxID=60912 RepID=UPI003D13642F